MFHPLRWLSGGPLFGEDEGPPRCAMCGLFIRLDSPDCWCPECRAILKAQREQDERRERERAGLEPPEDPVHRDGRR